MIPKSQTAFYLSGFMYFSIIASKDQSKYVAFQFVFICTSKSYRPPYCIYIPLDAIVIANYAFYASPLSLCIHN